jgi:hypothetical protein
MDNTQFCYWLKGYFELSGNKTYLNKKHLNIVRDHITLVSENVSWVCGFIQWLQGMIDATLILEMKKDIDMANISRVIKIKLDEQFDKKTVDRSQDDSTEEPAIFPSLFVPPVLPVSPISSEKTCSAWKEKLHSVLSTYPTADKR